MSECLRNACPCLERLWGRIFGDKAASSGAGGEGAGGAGGAGGGGGGGGAGSGSESPQPPGRHAESRAIYAAMWPFEGRHPEELSFQKGDLFSVAGPNGDWWTARKLDKNGRVLGSGLVPANYLTRDETLDKQPWYFGTMNRFEAQSHLLRPENEEAAFLIRHSDKDNIGYVLSVKCSSQVKHFKILKADEDHFYVEQNLPFSSLVDLVEHYRANSLSNVGRLGKPCKRKTANTEPDFPVDYWEIPKEELTLGDKLGSGHFAEVYRGRWKNHINVAIKIIKNDTEMNHQEFQREVQILKSLRHRHLISLFAVCTVSAPYYIITELMEKGSLLTLLRSKEGQQLDVMSLIDMGAQVADGMSYLEEQNSIHRDLAARNVLVGEDYICKVADFGLARVIKEPFYITEEKKIPYKWSAPEAISHGKFSIKSDVWSFGVLLYEIITYGGAPYPALSNHEVYHQVTHGYRMPAPPSCPDSLYQIMLQCWSADPDERPDFKLLNYKMDSSYVMD